MIGLNKNLSANSLLIEAVKKQLILLEKDEWKHEILSLAPPVLWFGNNNSNKPKILTIGANPSRKEFLKDNKAIAKEKFKETQSYNYLSGNNRRLFQIDDQQELKNILTNATLQQNIINGYNEYFQKNPYKWFGKYSAQPDLSYNVEGFLNGLNSSYFGNKEFNCLHIDLFPFATLSDFNSLTDQCEKDIFSDNWGELFLKSLIEFLDPELLIIFGKGNLTYFNSLFNLNKGTSTKFTEMTIKNKPSSCEYWSYQYKKIPTIGLSVNLGNPKGFDKSTIKSLGNEIKRKAIT